MTKRLTITILILVVVALGAAVWAYVQFQQVGLVGPVNTNQDTNVNQNINDSQNQNLNINASNEVTKEIEELINQIEDWSLYEKVSDGENGIFSFDSCGDEEFDQVIPLFNAGVIYSFKLNDGLQLVYTPNYKHWTNDKLLSLKSFCQAGAIWPKRAYKDKVLWIGSCGSGFKPEESSPEYQGFLRCLEAEKAVKIFLEQK